MAFANAGDTLDLGGEAPAPSELLVAGGAIGLALVLGLPAAATMFHRFRFPRDQPPDKSPAAGWVIGTAATGLIVLAGTMTVLAAMAGWHGLVSIAVAAAVFILSVDCLHTTVVDSTLLCLRWPDWIDALVGGMAAVVQGAALYWALLSGVDSGGAPLGYAFVLFAIAAAARMIASTVAGGVMYARGHNLHATFLALRWLHLQNELLRTIMAFVLVGFPIFIVTHSRAPGGQPWLNAAAAIAPILVLAIPVYWYACQRMLEHSQEQRANWFGGGFRTDIVDYEMNPRMIVTDTLKLAKEYFQWLRRGHGTAASRQAHVSPEGFIRTLSGNLALQVLIRSLLVIFTVIGLVMILTNTNWLEAPSRMSPSARARPRRHRRHVS